MEDRIEKLIELNAPIAQLTGGLGLTRQAVTKHLRVLAQAGIGRSSRSTIDQSLK